MLFDQTGVSIHSPNLYNTHTVQVLGITYSVLSLCCFPPPDTFSPSAGFRLQPCRIKEVSSLKSCSSILKSTNLKHFHTVSVLRNQSASFGKMAKKK